MDEPRGEVIVTVNRGERMSDGREWPDFLKPARLDNDSLRACLVRAMKVNRNWLDPAFFLERNLPEAGFKGRLAKNMPSVKFLTDKLNPDDEKWVSDRDLRLTTIKEGVIQTALNNPDALPKLNKALLELELIPNNQ